MAMDNTSAGEQHDAVTVDQNGHNTACPDPTSCIHFQIHQTSDKMCIEYQFEQEVEAI